MEKGEQPGEYRFSKMEIATAIQDMYLALHPDWVKPRLGYLTEPVRKATYKLQKANPNMEGISERTSHDKSDVRAILDQLKINLKGEGMQGKLLRRYKGMNEELFDKSFDSLFPVEGKNE